MKSTRIFIFVAPGQAVADENLYGMLADNGGMLIPPIGSSKTSTSSHARSQATLW